MSVSRSAARSACPSWSPCSERPAATKPPARSPSSYAAAPPTSWPSSARPAGSPPPWPTRSWPTASPPPSSSRSCSPPWPWRSPWSSSGPARRKPKPRPGPGATPNPPAVDGDLVGWWGVRTGGQAVLGLAVGEDDHTVADVPGLGQPQRPVAGVAREQPLAGAQHHREDHQPQLVDQPLVEQGLGQLEAAMDPDVALVALAQLLH